MKGLACSIIVLGHILHTSSFSIPTSSTNRIQHRPSQLQSLFSTKAPSNPVEKIIEETAEVKGEFENEFNWFKTWHPVVPVEYLDPEKPHQFKLLGMDIVIWNDGEIDKSPLFGPRKNRPKGSKKKMGNWKAFVDQCPHRKVPLSEGRIEDDGSLFCSYHGWRFDGEGDLIDIPQLSTKEELATIQRNPKSKCNSFPVQIVNGVLYVWPDASEDSKIQSLLTDVPEMKVKDADEDNMWYGPWNFRELPYGHDFFIENVVDGAHVGVSHHNVVGNRYNDQTMTMHTVEKLTKDGFTVGNGVTNDVADGRSTTAFNAPGQVIISSPYGNEGACQYLELYSSPSRPGFCNHVGRIVIKKERDGKMPGGFKQFTAPIPIWLNHLLASLFLNQDGLFLHAQERTLAHTKQYRASDPSVSSDNFADAILPVSTDRGVMLFRTWMKRVAGGMIPFQGDTTMPSINNDVVFDVYNAHTKHCKYCQDALKNLKRARFMMFFFAAFTAALRPKILGVGGSIFSGLAFSGIGGLLNKVIGMFYRFEFSHAANH
ncbi:hypothetical protein CTEN210_10911 [Chaetoceros tenuissimus]|uniref:Rieske domain-containing protein n=1 Tax=Chaetoceros tenuissimus TaxID=426638 RepID=A0AAD3D0K7_9STRA|nr:hypothetical protein CTEN210_10911 [Chaetoceros tenuissimus]